MAWGNVGDSTENQDMISGVVNKRILRVDNVNTANDAKKAAGWRYPAARHTLGKRRGKSVNCKL